ncbi:MAG TPA: PQQ-binding-like beta-propeller repeat protein [Planctomycetota bacterium]|nr:PQQ-binding-like beta-propeller repeat protein [Planctomycetota bacterium]
MRILIVILLAAAAGPAPLGSPKHAPTPENPIGWRGDGSGRYPGATPPTVWARKKSGNNYATQGILYMTRLPNGGVSCPIIVGDRIFVTTEVSDLVCIEKATGRVLWIRSNPEFEGVSAEERKATPAYAEKLEPLSAQLAKLNAELVEQCNGQSGSRNPLPAQAKKAEIEKQIQAELGAIDKKRFERNWAQAVFGFAGPTPVSDGKRVFAFFTTGVSVCYDLNGNRKWIQRGQGMGSEHGNFASPVLCGNRFVVWANEMRGYDAETGKLAWTVPAKCHNTYGSLFRVFAGGEWVAGFQAGYFVRVRDGQAIWGNYVLGDAVPTPIVEAGHLFAWMGYPVAGGENPPFRAWKLPAGAEGGKVSAGWEFKMEWAPDQLVIDKKKNPFDRSFCASPLFVDGLIYQVTEGGGLIVNDAATGELVYRRVLPMKSKTEYWGWAGASASPTLAGKHIYLMDNQGTTIVLQPGRTYKEVALNVLEDSKDGKTQEQNVSTPVFEGSRMYYRTPGYLYCIGER